MGKGYSKVRAFQIETFEIVQPNGNKFAAYVRDDKRNILFTFPLKDTEHEVIMLAIKKLERALKTTGDPD